MSDSLVSQASNEAADQEPRQLIDVVNVQLSDNNGMVLAAGDLAISPGVNRSDVDDRIRRIVSYSGSHFIGYTRIAMARLSRQAADVGCDGDKKKAVKKAPAKKKPAKKAAVKKASKPAKKAKGKQQKGLSLDD